MSKTLAARILHPVWKIERDWLRRILIVPGVTLVAVLRVAGVLLIPLAIALLAIMTIANGAIEFCKDLPGQFIATWRGEFECWRELRKGVPLVWATSHSKRWVPTLIQRSPREGHGQP